MYRTILSLTSVLDGGGWSASRPGRFTPRKDPVPIEQEAGWFPRPVWTAEKHLAPIGIRSPDRPARRKSQYPLSYVDPPPDSLPVLHLIHCYI